MGWATARANNQRTSYNPSGSTDISTQAWTYPLGAGQSFVSAPIITADGIAFLEASASQLYLTSLDANGILRWSTPVTINGKAMLGYRQELASDASGRIYMAGWDVESFVACYGADGSLVWSDYGYFQIGACPVVDSATGNVYVLTTDGSYQLNLLVYNSSGVLQATRVLTAYWGEANQGVLAYDGTTWLYAADDNFNNAPCRFQADGTLGWYGTGADRKCTGAAPILDIANGRLYAPLDVGAVPPEYIVPRVQGAMSASDGSYVWQAEKEITVDPAQVPLGVAADGTLAYVAVYHGNQETVHLEAYSPDAGTLVWTGEDSDNFSTQPAGPSVGSDGALWSTGVRVMRLSVSDGTTLDEVALAGCLQPVIGDDLVLLACTGDNTLYAYAAGASVAPTHLTYGHGAARATTLTNEGYNYIGGGDPATVRTFGIGMARATALLASTQAVLEYRFAGTGDGGALSGQVFSDPTLFTLTNPEPGKEYELEMPAADVEGWLTGRMGNGQLRRVGSGGNYTGEIIVRAVELPYVTG